MLSCVQEDEDTDKPKIEDLDEDEEDEDKEKSKDKKKKKKIKEKYTEVGLCVLAVVHFLYCFLDHQCVMHPTVLQRCMNTDAY